MKPALFLVATVVLAGCAAPGAELDPAAALGVPRYDPVGELAARIDAALDAGGPIVLSAMQESDPLGVGRLSAPIDFTVTLARSPLLNGTPFAEIDGVPVAFPDVDVYEGSVEGHPEFPVRLTVTPDWARGTIRMNDTLYLVRMNLDGNLPYYESPNATATALSSAGLKLPLPTFYDKDGIEAEECTLMPVPEHVTPMAEPLPGPTDAAPIVSRILLDGDAQFGDALGPHAFPMMIAFLNEVDGIYAHELGLRFELAGVHLHTDPEYFPDPADEAPVTKAAEYWNARDVDRDVVHVFTGQYSSYAMANCIGGAGHPEIAYTFTPLNWAADTIVFHEMAMAHELGHIFSAHHHYGNHVEASWNRNTLRPAGVAEVITMPQGGLATIMIQGYTPGAKPVFGTLEKSVIRGWAENELQ